MELELRSPAEKPEIEKLVIIFREGQLDGEMGAWDGSEWVDQAGYEQKITCWCHFPTLRKPAPRRLLILGCSASKDHAQGKLPAIERYTGAYYQMVHGQKGPRPEIVILSAEHGFIGARTNIEDYDRRMDKARAAELLPGASIKLGALLRWERYDEVFIAAGEEYRKFILLALKGCLGVKFLRVGWARGGIGTQRKQLKEWLAA